ncbi:MAG: PRC-barrel domain-containing protein [Pirellulaceae bacterium]
MAQLKASPKAEAGERRETRRIPVIDADAGATFRSSQLIGTNIIDAEGRTLGKVVDIVSDSRGNILYLIVSYSGSAGPSGKLFAVPYTGLSFQGGANGATTARFLFDPQLLRNAPSFTSTRFPDFSDQAFVSELAAFNAAVLAATAIDPTLPANGPGDRPATRAGTSGAAAIPGGTVVGRTGSPASASIPSAAADEVRTVARVDASAAASRMTLRSSQMVGLSIQDKDGHTIGKVIDFVSDGNRQFVVVSLSGDKRNIVLPASALQFQAGANGSSFATLRVAPGQLENAPSFTGSEWPDFSSEEFLTNFQDFYQPLLPDVSFNPDGSTSTTVEGGTTPGGSRSTPGGTRTPDWPSRPIPPGGPVPRPGPETDTPTTGTTTPGGSRSTPGGTRTPDWPSRPIPPGGPVPRPGTETSKTGKTTTGGSKSTPGGTRTPDWPSRPIPPGGPVPRPGTETGSPTTAKTTPGGSRSTPGGTRTPDWPSRPIPPGGPVPRPGAVGPRIPAPGTKVPGVPAVPAVPGGPGVPATPAVPAAPSSPGPSAPGGGGSGGGSASGK